MCCKWGALSSPKTPESVKVVVPAPYGIQCDPACQDTPRQRNTHIPTFIIQYSPLLIPGSVESRIALHRGARHFPNEEFADLTMPLHR